MKYLTKITLIFALITSNVGYGRSIPEINRFLMDEIKKLSVILGDSENGRRTFKPGPISGGIVPEYELSEFSLIMKAPVGFDVFFGKIELVPAVEMVWK